VSPNSLLVERFANKKCLFLFKSYNKIGDLINNKNDSTGQILATTNEDKVDILNNYFASGFINETYEEVEEAISGTPNMEWIR